MRKRGDERNVETIGSEGKSKVVRRRERMRGRDESRREGEGGRDREGKRFNNRER
jgi:hypothetical protein